MRHLRPEFLVTPTQLFGLLSNPDVVVLDCTSAVVPSPDPSGFAVETGERAFLDGHIPGARFADIERDLSVPAEGLLFTLPPVEIFAHAMNALGVGATSRVVLYSTGQPGWAARVWLMLRAFGFDNAAILDGGWAAWKNAGLPIETGPATSQPAPAAFFAWMERDGVFVSTADVEARDGAVLVNALGRDAFSGTAPISYGRPGRIPGSVSIPTASLVDPQTGRYLDQRQLEAIFEEAGIGPDDALISYCGAGVAASNVAFARLLSGADASTAVYDGSLLEWNSDPRRPVETG